MRILAFLVLGLWCVVLGASAPARPRPAARVLATARQTHRPAAKARGKAKAGKVKAKAKARTRVGTTTKTKTKTKTKARTEAKTATRAARRISNTRTRPSRPAEPRPQALSTTHQPKHYLLSTKKYRLRTVVLDAGHGGKDPGCNGRDHYEADVALAIIKDLGRKIEAEMPGVKVIYTRKTDVFVELDERAAIANRHHADLFISVHCNAGPPSSHGTEVWTMGLHKTTANLSVAQRENSVILQEKDYEKHYDGFDPRSPQSHILFSLYQSAYITNSLRLAQRIDRAFRHDVGRDARGVKQAGFLVLWKSTMPSVLVEAGFLTNHKEEEYLSSRAGQQALADGIFEAFRAYKRDLEGGGGEE